MKTQSISLRAIKAIGATVIALVAFLNSNAAVGGRNEEKITSLTEQHVNVQYIGSNETNVVFRVEFENPTTEKFWLIIKNDNGDVIFRKQFSDAHFAKSIYFNNEEGADIHPTFIFRNGDKEVVRQFAVSKTVTENTVVTRL